jgi:AraC family transcriptional activator of pyochelin receptor
MGSVPQNKCASIGYVETWPELTAVYGDKLLKTAPRPVDPVTLIFRWGSVKSVPHLLIDEASNYVRVNDGHQLALIVRREAFSRIGGECAKTPGPRYYHLPVILRSIAISLQNRTRTGESQKAYSLAKSLELLCETIRLEGAGELVPLSGTASLSCTDTLRILDARKLIDECWSEKLNITRIAKACGLNRARLTSGFREFFKCSVTQALSEKRLSEASKLLLTTDVPVSSIGYRSGYLSNAAFSRAFSRRFGTSPTSFRTSASQA